MVDDEAGRETAAEGVESAPVSTASFSGPGCDACGSNMQPMGHCKYLCRRCGFLRTCIDTV